MTQSFSGLWPVMLTAFEEDGSLDLPGVDALVDFYLEGGSGGLFAVCQVGTGEDHVVHARVPGPGKHGVEVAGETLVRQVRADVDQRRRRRQAQRFG